MYSKAESGFTLVELAIVVMVIGVLIAGVLKGEELVQNARVTNIVKQMEAMDSAVIGFRQTYESLPGDIENPARRLPDCTSAPCNIAGNGDGIVGTTLIGTFTNAVISAPETTENRRFWLHLAVTGMISGIDATGRTLPGPCGATCGDFGNTYPASAIKGTGFSIVHQSVAAFGNYPATDGHYLWLSAMPDRFIAALTAHQAAALDQKKDDGMPFTGEILAVDFSNGCIQGTVYREAIDGRYCGVAARFIK